MFQFHNGTINTIPFLCLRLFLHRFNSTTVQLIHLSNPDSLTETLFQFHNGTINTVKYQNEENLKQVSIPQRYN